jgi:hypothetical protein
LRHGHQRTPSGFWSNFADVHVHVAQVQSFTNADQTPAYEQYGEIHGSAFQCGPDGEDHGAYERDGKVSKFVREDTSEE